ncbi:PAS domain S-box protein [bacterium]|nr:PAS domain S-box protein [candidate division CSSED10-310 bacterium]
MSGKKKRDSREPGSKTSGFHELDHLQGNTALCNRRYLELTELLPEAYFEMDPEGRIISANHVLREKFGYQKADIDAGLRLLDLMDTGESVRIQAFLDTVFKDPGIHQQEYLGRRKDGGAFPVLIRSKSFFPSFGVDEACGIIQDMSEQKQTQDTLRIQLAAMETSIDGMAIIRKTGEFVFLNKAFTDIYGFSCPRDMIGRSWREMFSDREYLRLKREVIPAVDRSGNWRGRMVGMRQDRTAFRQDLSLTLVRGGWYIMVVRDITSESLAEEALRESEEKFRKISSSAQDAIIMLDNEGNITYWNEAAEKILGYRDREVIGKDCHLLLAPGSYHKAFLSGFREFRHSGAGTVIGKTTDIEAVRKDGSVFPADLSVSSVKIRGAWHAIGIMRDVTHRRKLEEEILKASKLESLGALAGGIAHDFNNILTGLTGSIYMAKHFSRPGDKVHNMLLEAERAVLRAKDLSQQLLSFSKGGSPIKDVISLVPLIRNSMMYSLRGTAIRSKINLPEDLWFVEADPSQMGQVIDNLVTNAVQAMPSGGNIHITGTNCEFAQGDHPALKPGRYVELNIRDEGVGILKDNLTRVFDPFFSTKPGSTGLGLTIAYSIIRKHNGSIQLESTPGQGTLFSVYLQAAADQTHPVWKKEVCRELVRGSGRILVMDDEEIVRNVLKEYLEQMGYSVDLALEGSEAVSKYREAYERNIPFDAVVMDLTVRNGMGGTEAMERLLEIDPAVKAIVSSGYSQDPVMADYRSYGFLGVVRKPFDIEDLSRTIADILNNESAF